MPGMYQPKLKSGCEYDTKQVPWRSVHTRKRHSHLPLCVGCVTLSFNFVFIVTFRFCFISTMYNYLYLFIFRHRHFFLFRPRLYSRVLGSGARKEPARTPQRKCGPRPRSEARALGVQSHENWQPRGGIPST